MHRTKQQVACDGVQTMWHTDTFTEILQHQVQTRFSMDGVIPAGVMVTKRVQVSERVSKTVVAEKERFASLIGNMDGIIRVPVRQTYTSR